MRSFKNTLFDLFACIPVSVVVALVLMAAVALVVTKAYCAINFFGG